MVSLLKLDEKRTALHSFILLNENISRKLQAILFYSFTLLSGLYFCPTAI